jgi:hypothetical protein
VTTIKIVTLWGIGWIAWCLALLVGWTPLVPDEIRRDYLLWVLVVFFPLELVGAYDLRNDTGQEVAKTLSQLMQAIAQTAKPGTAWYRSWNAVPAGFSLLLAWTAYYVIEHPVPGAVAALTVVGLNLFHWLRRGKYG